MRKIIFLAIFVAIASSYVVSVGSCVKYSWNGRQCQKCSQNYHLFDGVCYSDIPNCLDYISGFSCQKCAQSTILVSNQCLNASNVQKLLRKQGETIEPYSIEKNFNIVSRLIEFVEKIYLKSNYGQLVGLDVRRYDNIQRWFLLYQFENKLLSYQRIIIDINLKTFTFNPVDFSPLRNPDDFSFIFWKDVDNLSSVMSIFSPLSSNEKSYLKIYIKKALFSEVDQFEIFTLTNQQIKVQEVCTYKGHSAVVLSVFSHSLGSSSNVSPQSLTANPNHSFFSSRPFHGYQLTYQRQQIDAQMDVNDGLFAAVNLIKKNLSQNHTLIQVVESGKSYDLTQFTIFSQSQTAILKSVINFNPVTGNMTIIDVFLESKKDQNTETSANSQSLSDEQAISSQYIDNKVQQDGCITHTSYAAPFKGELKQLAEKLSKLKNDHYMAEIRSKTNSSTPFIRGPNLVTRRIVVSSFCDGFNMKQVAFVESENSTGLTTEYFTYYIEKEDEYGDKQWYYMGNKTKNQTSTVYSNPLSYPVHVVDPSFVNYPYANLYSQNGVLSEYLSKLNDDDRATFMGLSMNFTTENDRLMGKISRFSVDGKNSANQNYRATGWKVHSLPMGFDDYMYSVLCVEYMITESVTIGSAGPKSPANSASPLTTSNMGNNLIRVQDSY